MLLDLEVLEALVESTQTPPVPLPQVMIQSKKKENSSKKMGFDIVPLTHVEKKVDVPEAVSTFRRSRLFSTRIPRKPFCMQRV